MTLPDNYEQVQQWVQRSLAGNDAACQALYSAFAGQVKGYLFRRGFGHADVEDLTQDVFLRVFKALDSFDPARGAFRLWLAVIARNVARSARSRRGDGASFDPALAEDMLLSPGNPSDSSQLREEMDAVRAGVQSLPDELARIVRLRYVEGLTTRGIASAVGTAEATVRLRLSEAVGLLARHLRAKGVS